MEHWEELKPGGYRMVWEDALFRPGTDTFLLSAFPRLKAGMRVCDLGSGTGLLGLLLLQREQSRPASVTEGASSLTVTGIEILPEAAALARRCSVENGLTERLFTVRADLRTVKSRFSSGSFDLVIANPPYYAAERGKRSPNQTRQFIRSETSCTLEDLARAAAYLLRRGGAFCLVHKPERLADLLCILRESGCEAKRLRFVCERPGAAPSLLLLEGRREGKPALSVEAPLILRNPDGSFTAEYHAIYFREDWP